jgi:hypothetical protein
MVGLKLDILQNANVNITYFKGGTRFSDLVTLGEVGNTGASSFSWSWPNFADN